MGPLTKFLLTPVELALAFISPFVLVIGGFATLLGCLYLLIGLNPAEPVNLFLVDSFEATQPIVSWLAVIWVLYNIFYFVLGSFAWNLPPLRSSRHRPTNSVLGSFHRDLSVGSLALDRLTQFWRRRGLRLWPQSTFTVFPVPPLSLLLLRQRCRPVWLACGWRAGDSVQLN